MKNFFKKTLFSLVIGVMAVLLVTIGIDASDNYDNLSQSIIGRLMFGEDAGPCGTDMVFVPNEIGGFCIDRYEASVGSACPHTTVTDQLMTRDNLDRQDCMPVSRPEATPWRFISQSQAMNACAKAGKRLPTDAEWYQASLGTPDRAGDWGPADCQVSSNWNEQPGQTGQGEACVSSFGAYDMVGNVWEWVKGEINDGVYNGVELPPTGFVTAVDINGIPVSTSDQAGDPNFNQDYLWIKNSGLRGMARGGYWDNKTDAGIYAMYLVSPSAFAGTGVGFRCAK